jgi:Mg-chelatase subunit ChlD
MSIEKFKPPTTSGGIQLNKGKLSSSSTPFQQRVNQARSEQVDAALLPHRICLMLDKSSSMSALETVTQSRIDLLKDAVNNFIARCSFNDTAVAIRTFPESLQVELTNNPIMLQGAMFGIDASGGTPMQACVQRVITDIPITRAIIVSDGEATDWHEFGDTDNDGEFSKYSPGAALLKTYKDQAIPIDCVHIGSSSSGEELLRRIARETGGLYLKFTDVSAFAKSFGFLTPGYRAQLTDGSVSASQLGAKELK